MKRILVLLMLCLLPLQTSWATVADYCGHGKDQATQHFGHHNEEHNPLSGMLAGSAEPGEGNSIPGDPDQNSNLGHDHSHLSSFLGVLGVYTLVICAPLQQSLRCDDKSYSFLAADKPARPNWFVTA